MLVFLFLKFMLNSMSSKIATVNKYDFWSGVNVQFLNG